MPLYRAPSRSRLLAAGAALATAGGLAALAAPVQAAPDHRPARPGPVATLSPAAHQRLADLAAARKIRGPFGMESRGRTSVFVQFTGTGAADAAGRVVARGSREAAARSRRAAVGRTADRVLATAHGRDSGARKIFEVANAVPGMGIRADDAAITAMARRFDVAKITPIPRHTVSNASAAQLTRVLNTWRSVGDTGRGVTIGVIDTGLDYTHSDFGGRGTTKAYDAALADETDPDWRDALPALGRAKVAGGFDFVGNAYDAGSDDPALNTPVPDPNPIDCGEHGTHVAGTAAGYGVTGNGHTFTGAYSRLTGSRLASMRVGPGMAPRARLYPLKVFGCEGQTDMVIPALDKALDPNGDGDFSDHLDIVNLSLGADYAPVDDPENDVVNELTRHGVLAVVSMGNNGDLTDTGSAPGNAVSSLAVASSVDAMQLRDGLRVNAPASVRGIAAGQVSQAFDWAHERRVTGEVVAISGVNADGCDSLSRSEAAAVAGKVAWLEWDDNDATRRCGSVARSANVKAAGAIGAIFTSTLEVFNAGIAGDADIPVFQLPKSQTNRLRPVMNAGTLNVTFDGALIGTIRDVTPSITDTISSFTSRGPHGSVGVVKPDVTAPGDTITSAGMGSGNNQLTISGTSMASPHTAGIAALVKSRHPRWSPRAVKAAVMNTAVHDLFTKPARTGRRYGPARVGAGRVDAQRAVNTKVLAYVAGDNNPVSASFGPVPVSIAGGTTTRTRTVTVQNTGKRPTTVRLRYAPAVSQPGVSYSVSRRSLTVPRRAARTVHLTMRIVPSRLRHTIDPTMATTQLDVARQYVADASGRLVLTPRHASSLRVPVYGAAKPASTTTAAADTAANQVTLSGRGVSQGTGSTAYTSLASVLQLGARSGTLPLCVGGQVGGCTYNATTRGGDLKYVGAGSTDDWLWFGIATRGQWASLGETVAPVVDYDVTGTPAPDFETFVTNLPGDGTTDVLTAVTINLNAAPDADNVVDVEPVNFNFGDVDTNVFDSDVITLPVAKGLLGLDPDTAPITYTVSTVDGVVGADIDRTGPIRYDASDPDVATAGPLFRDENGAAIDYTVKKGVNDPMALVLHLHGLPGHRSEVVELAQ